MKELFHLIKGIVLFIGAMWGLTLLLTGVVFGPIFLIDYIISLFGG